MRKIFVIGTNEFNVHNFNKKVILPLFGKEIKNHKRDSKLSELREHGSIFIKDYTVQEIILSEETHIEKIRNFLNKADEKFSVFYILSSKDTQIANFFALNEKIERIHFVFPWIDKKELVYFQDCFGHEIIYLNQ